MYFSLLIATTLAAGLILHALASLFSYSVWRLSRRRLEAMHLRSASKFLLALRFGPFLLTWITVVLLVVPSFLEFEPRATSEPLSLTLLSLAGVTLVIVSGSLWRCFAAAMQSRRVMRTWLRSAEEVSFDGLRVQRCEMESPAVAVLGFWDVKIFASPEVFETLSQEELAAALRHEAVHVRRFDVLKKFFFQLAPQFLPGFDLLKDITAHWSRVCELAADEESVAGSAPQTLHLASALVKVARLAQSEHGLPTLSAALHGRESLLSRRVLRLLEMSERSGVIVRPAALDLRKILLAASCLIALLLAAYPQTLNATHELLEFLVRG